MQHTTYRNTMSLVLQRDIVAQNLSLHICIDSSAAKELVLLFKGYKTDTKSWHNQLDVCD